MSGFYAGLPSSWELIVDSGLIPKPWAREHAINDLRYQMDLVRLGRITALPPQRVLETRWGWGWRSIDRLVQSPEEWADEKGLPLARELAAAVKARAPKVAGQDRGKAGAAAGQDRGDTARANAANDDAPGQDRGRTGAGPGQDRGTRDQDLRARDHSAQITDHRSQDLEEEIPGPPAPSEPAADPPRPVLVLTPPGDPAPKRTRKASPPPPAAAPSYAPDQREALVAFKAIMAAFAGQPRCEWITRPADDERWLIELHAEIGEDTDMPEQFAKMRDWLDGELRRKQAGKSSKFPKSHQAFMRNWLKRATADPGPRHGIDRDRDPAYRGVPDGFEPPKEYRHVKFITPADIVHDPDQPF